MPTHHNENESDKENGMQMFETQLDLEREKSWDPIGDLDFVLGSGSAPAASGAGTSSAAAQGTGKDSQRGKRRKY